MLCVLNCVLACPAVLKLADTTWKWYPGPFLILKAPPKTSVDLPPSPGDHKELQLSKWNDGLTWKVTTKVC